MTSPLFPESEWLIRRWKLEKVLHLSAPLLGGIGVFMGVLLGGMFLLPHSLGVLTGILWAVPMIWGAASLLLAGRFLWKADAGDVARRADRVLGLPDDLLALTELEENGWRTATWKRAQRALSPETRSWPLVFPKWYWGNAAFAIFLTLGTSWLGWNRLQGERREQAALDAAREDRVAAAEEIARDWEEFAKTTDDPELKKLFSEAARLREAVRDGDSMTAMLAMNRIEQKMTSLQDVLAAESLSPQAARMAEALEAFEGLGALGAALRNQNFGAAAAEAAKQGARLDRDPSGTSALRRGEVVAEMLANEAATAQKRGNTSLSQTLSQLSSVASQNSKTGTVPNAPLSQCLAPLKNLLSKEASCKACGRAVAVGKCQMESLRQKFRGEPCERPPSLCKSGNCNKPGGLKAGTGTDGQPLGDPTKLSAPGEADHVAGTMGEGESETTTTAASSGTAATVGPGAKTPLAGYLELSERAVADESLPLAHRRAIRTYFERIRPVAESQHSQ